AAFEVNAAQSAEGQEQDFSAVILEMEKQAHLGSADNRRTRVISEEAYPAVPGGARCGMRTGLSRRSGRPRRIAQWPGAYRFRSFRRRFLTKRAALLFYWSGDGRRDSYVLAAGDSARRR